MCTIRVFSRLSVTPSFPRIFVAWARAELASARVRQVTTQSSAHRVSWYPLCLISLSKGGQQDIAQQRRHDSSLRSSSWSLVKATLVFIARFQHLLDKDQHSAVGDLLSDKCH